MITDPKLIDIFPDEHDGYPDHLAAEDTRDVLWDVCGATAREFPKSWWIEPREWEERTKYNDAHGLWPINYVDRTTHQGGTHECTTHSLRAVFEAARNRQRALELGPPNPGQLLPISATSASVWVSCLSIYSEANPRIRGGANVRQVMEIAVRRGFLPDKIQPKDWGFKHYLTGTQGRGNATQSSGEWVRLQDFPTNWQETSMLLRPLEVILPESWEQSVCCVLNGAGVGVGRSGHAVPWMRRTEDGNMQYPDSYDRFLYDSERTQKSAWRGSFCIVSTTVPDDWDKPAG